MDTRILQIQRILTDKKWLKIRGNPSHPCHLCIYSEPEVVYLRNLNTAHCVKIGL